jgi:hypothetical protein
MQLHSSRPTWWRFPAPSILVLVLALSCLPWLEIGCESKLDTSTAFGGLTGGKGGPTIGSGRTLLVSQSGLQIATGGHTDINHLGNTPANTPKGLPLTAPGQPGSGDGPGAAPLLFVFFLTVLAAIVIGFVRPPGRLRLWIVGTCTLSATIILLVQALILGFPAANDVAKHMRESKAAQELAGQDMVKLFVSYTPWYWLTWALLIGALVVLALEEMTANKNRQLTYS